MKFDDPMRASIFDWLVFPAAGGVPLSALAAIGLVKPPRINATKLAQSSHLENESEKR
jgi:hypothetical protein